MFAEHRQGGGEGRVLGLVAGDCPLLFTGVGGDQLHRGQAAGVEGFAQEFDPGDVVGAFVPDAGVGDVEAVDALGAAEEVGDVVGHVLRVIGSAADPGRRAPAEGVERESGGAAAGLLHQPPLVAAGVVRCFRAGAAVAGLGAAGGVHLAADFDFEMLEGCAEFWGEQQVEDLAALGLGVIG